MTAVVKRLRIKRALGWLYFLRGTDVWRAPVKRASGVPNGRKAELVVNVDFERDDAHYIYFLDSNGNISKAPRIAELIRRKEEANKPKAKQRIKPLPLSG